MYLTLHCSGHFLFPQNTSLVSAVYWMDIQLLATWLVEVVFDYSWYATAELPTVLTGALRRRRELRRSEEFAVHIYVLPASYTEDKHRAHLFPWHHLRLQDIVESASEINNS